MHRKGLIGYVIRSLVPLLRGKVIKGQLAPPPSHLSFPQTQPIQIFKLIVKIVSLRMTTIPPLATPLRVKVLDFEAN